MTIHYRNTFPDVVHFVMYHYPRMRAMQVFIILSFLVLCWLFWGTAPSDLGAIGRLIYYFLMFLPFIVVLVIIVPVVTILGMVSKMNKTFLTEHTMTITPDSLVEQTKYAKAEWHWRGIQAVRRTGQHLFLYVGQHSAHIVPRRAFASESERDQFYEKILEYKTNQKT
jgi:hypothetical protein